ncbi:hypothetical protein C7M84_005345 [Penaeus vannamei]|uniref:Peptidase S1 domain-containing protein n=1 Tax=Penaeus vannamei TaxID=6689 RepID=A0A3R7SUT7_PENVA|nr:hypothetical protein C7M84_005345 [Penaeus vannamei]
MHAGPGASGRGVRGARAARRRSGRPSPSCSVVGRAAAPSPRPRHACTASIVAPTWVLAAYSCLSGKHATWELVTGQTSRTDRQTRQVVQLVRFPGTVRTGGLWTGDATNHTCVVAGWNRGERGGPEPVPAPPPRANARPRRLQHHPLSGSPEQRPHLCRVQRRPVHTPCHGDEGSPLMCFVGGVWRLEGLFSHHARCDPARHPAVFTALHALQPSPSVASGDPRRAI